MTTATPPRWLKPVTDYAPLAIFLLAYLTWGLIPATVALMVTTAAGITASLLATRRVPVMPLVTAVIVGIFGGLTLWLNDETFIKMKPTIVEALFSVVLFGGLAVGRPLLKPLFGAAWRLDEAGWRRLTLRFACFFAAMAALNEIVWRTQSTDFWVAFKVFGIIGLTVVFALTQAPLLMRHAAEAGDRDGGGGDP